MSHSLRKGFKRDGAGLVCPMYSSLLTFSDLPHRVKIPRCPIPHCAPGDSSRDRSGPLVLGVSFSQLSHMLTDALVHLIIPRHPLLRPHARMLHHFRFILPLLPRGEDGLSPLHYYDSAIQLARHASREPTEREFNIGMDAAAEIKRV